MGKVSLPVSGTVYLDTQVIIYSVEKHPQFEPILRPFWMAAAAGSLQCITSELTLLETLVGPMKSGDAALASSYERLLASTDIRMVPISRAILLDAARLRASANLRTPDAIHAATAIDAKCTSCITNDAALSRIAGLATVLLTDLFTP
jgi:predicted nucleic acid-binding protein